MNYEAFQLRVRHGDVSPGGSLVSDLSIGQLADITAGRLTLGTMPPQGGHLEPLGRVVVDSREISEGDTFWALPGAKSNGAHYVEDAFLRAAAGAVVAGRFVEPWAGKYCIHVNNTNQALFQLARWARCQFPGYVVAIIDGQNQQITPAGAIIAHVLHSTSNSSAHCADQSCRVQTALAILDWQKKQDCAVVQIPVTPDQKICRISHLCSPHITAITSAHITHRESASSREAIATTQDRLRRMLPSDGLVVLNGDDPHLRQLARELPMPVLQVGERSDCDIVATRVHGRNGEPAYLVDNQQILLPVGRQHGVTAALMAYVIGRMLSVSVFDLIDALESFVPLAAHNGETNLEQVRKGTNAA
jgi:UDP-N-acetylmuramyl pentapeptide synthase